jgi:hypothetical protein
MKKHKLPQINIKILASLSFFILAVLSWFFYQIPAITIGDTTYVLFIFIPFLASVMGGIFLALHMKEVAKIKEETFKEKGKASLLYYRTKSKKQINAQSDKTITASLSVGLAIGILLPILITSGVVGFPVGVPGVFAAYENPTYMDAIIFVAQDQTDKNEYIFPDYVCTHFTEDFVDNARSAGWRAGYVRLNNPDGPGHAIAVFLTTDMGLFFVEPQNDFIFPSERMSEMLDEGYYTIAGMDMPLNRYTIDWNNPIW